MAERSSMTGRPSASVIVPFAGSQEELQDLAERLGALVLAAGDEVVVCDNRARPPAPDFVEPTRVRWCAANGIASPAFARNAGARMAGGEWLVFIDADTEPDPGLLDAYFQPEPAAEVGVLAGGITDIPAGDTLTERYVAARNKLSQRHTLDRPRAPYAQTANCAVRRSAFEQVGGFVSRIRAGEDADLCFRLLAAGWSLDERPGARVKHRARADLRAMVAQLARHGAGAAWLNRRYPDTFPPAGAIEQLRRGGHYLVAAARALAAGDREGAGFALLDLAALWAFAAGRRLSNFAD